LWSSRADSKAATASSGGVAGYAHVLSTLLSDAADKMDDLLDPADDDSEEGDR
jgi:hypothetical protein